MCGITGYYALSSSCSAEPDLEAMTDVLAHRGPDDRGLYRDGRAGLGMRRLSIIDLAHGKQPIPNETGRLQVIFNGEIYNYRELRAQLTACGHGWSTGSDTEAIVHGYEEWGDQVVTRLRG
ncbi:MAG: asparagine synthetase B, partial [Rudaea sp.]